MQPIPITRLAGRSLRHFTPLSGCNSEAHMPRVALSAPGFPPALTNCKPWSAGRCLSRSPSGSNIHRASSSRMAASILLSMLAVFDLQPRALCGKVYGRLVLEIGSGRYNGLTAGNRSDLSRQVVGPTDMARNQAYRKAAILVQDHDRRVTVLSSRRGATIRTAIPQPIMQIIESHSRQADGKTSDIFPKRVIPGKA